MLRGFQLTFFVLFFRLYFQPLHHYVRCEVMGHCRQVLCSHEPWDFHNFLAIANHRFFIHFGEDHCRLSSDQAILEEDRKESLVLAIISNTLLFGFPNWHQARFESLWVDQLAYTSPWRKHVEETDKGLKQQMSSVCLIAAFLGLFLTIPSRCLHFLCESLSIHGRPGWPLPLEQILLWSKIPLF